MTVVTLTGRGMYVLYKSSTRNLNSLTGSEGKNPFLYCLSLHVFQGMFFNVLKVSCDIHSSTGCLKV